MDPAPRTHGWKRTLATSEKEMTKMDSVLNCGGNGWFMIASAVVFYGLLALAGAALVKYLLSGGRSRAAA